MRVRARVFLVLSLAALAAAILLGGCGGGGSGGGSDDPASIAPAGSPVFVAGSIRPQGEVKSNVESLVQKVAGISNPGQRIIDELDKSLADAKTKQKLTYQNDIEPWLGEKGAIFFERYDGEGFKGIGGIVQTTDSDAAADFVQNAKEPGDKDASYNGVDYVISADDGTAVGVVGDFLVVGQDEQTFKDAVDVSDGGDSLADDDKYKTMAANIPDGSLADVYVDIGGLIHQAGSSVDPQALRFYDSLGYDAEHSTALASLVPGSDQLELDATTKLGGQSIPTGDVADLLGSFPADSLAAFATPDFGTRIKQAIDQLDKVGIPPEVPPGALKSTLARTGIDLDKITSAIGDVGGFVEGTDLRSIGGALVLTTSDPAAARDTVKSVAALLRRSSTRGFTPVTGNAPGFAFRTPGLGPKPLVVLASGQRIAVGYGVDATEKAVSAPSSDTLADSLRFQAAGDSLGGTNLTGYVDFGGLRELADSLGLDSNPDIGPILPYLDKVDFLAIGAGSEGDLSVAKLIVALKK